MIDDLMDRVDGGGLALTGEGGLLPELVKAVLERGLAAELTGHLGYEKNDPAGRGSPNSRNGHSPKTIATEVGDVAFAVPRDRAGTFEPRLVPKGSRRAGGLDEEFWAGVCAELRNRGTRDTLIVCCDGLTGFPEAIEATWPQATVQTCTVRYSEPLATAPLAF